MTTTALIVEVLVVGAMALMWVVGGYLVLLSPPALDRLEALVSPGKQFLPLFVIPCLASMYAIGWIVNYLSEQMLKPLFEKRVRKDVFGDRADTYNAARLRVMTSASSEVLRDLQLDRHIVRVSRGGVVNFLGLAAVSAIASTSGWPLQGLAVICLACAFVCFAQWRSRYRHHYVRIRDLDGLLAATASMESSAQPERTRGAPAETS